MDSPDLSGLTRKTIQTAMNGIIMSPERDAVIFTAVKDGIDQAYQSGTEVNKHSRRPYLYASGVLLTLALLVYASVLATQHFPTLSLPANKSVFVDGAPNWETVIAQDSQAQAQSDFVVVDVKAKMGADWGFAGVVQYKDYLYIRTVNLVDNMKVRTLVYHWTVLGSWQYYDAQDS